MEAELLRRGFPLASSIASTTLATTVSAAVSTAAFAFAAAVTDYYYEDGANGTDDETDKIVI